MMPSRSQMELALASRTFGEANRDTGFLGDLADKLHQEPEAILKAYGSLIAKTVPGIEPAVRAATLGFVGTEDIYKNIGKLIFEVAKYNTDLADVMTVVVMEPSIFVAPFMPGPLTVALAIEKLTKFHLERYLIAMVVCPVIGPILVGIYDGLAWCLNALANLLGLGGPSPEELAAANRDLAAVTQGLEALEPALRRITAGFGNPDDYAPGVVGVGDLATCASVQARYYLSQANFAMSEARNSTPAPFTEKNFDKGMERLRQAWSLLQFAQTQLVPLAQLVGPCEAQVRAATAQRASQDIWRARVPELAARADAVGLDVTASLASGTTQGISSASAAIAEAEAAAEGLVPVAEGPSRALLCLGAGVLLWGIVD